MSPRALPLLLVLLVAGACATPFEAGVPVASAPPGSTAELSPEAALERQMWNRLVGRWEGRVDLTFPDATLLVNSVKRVQGRWVVEALYGTTNVFIAEVPATLEVGGNQTTLVLTTQLGDARLTLWQEDDLRGVLRLTADDRDRSLELRRVAATRGKPQPRPSTAVERVGQTLRDREPAPQTQTARAAAPEPPASPASAPPVKASTLGDLATALPGLLVGRWEGSLDFTVSARLLIVDSVKPEGGAFSVQARYGVADADLGPVAVTLDLTDDTVTLRFTSTFASRVVLTLEQDGALRGGFKLAFEARERRMELKRVDQRDRDPLTVLLKSPANQARVSDPAAVVAAVVSAGRGVAHVGVTLNGVEVHRRTEPAPTRSVAVSAPVTLVEGTNVIVVTARDAAGQVRQEMATVVYARPAPAAAAVSPTPTPASPPAPPPAIAESMRGEKRVALVIGNGTYQHTSPLRNPVNDARAMAATLRALGFEVLARENAAYKDMKRAVDDFGDRLRGGGVGIFYYAGHGVQVEGRNYLVPTDAEIRSEREVEIETIDVARVLARMEEARNRLNIVVLDACRDNPFGRSFRSGSRGLAAIDAPSGTLIAYATSPGKLARDGEGANGLYTGELLQAMRQPGLRLEDVFKRVRQAVRVKTSGEQVPWEASSVEGDFYFALPGSRR